MVIGQRPWAQWKGTQVKAEQCGAGVRVTVAGEYAEGKGQFALDIIGDSEYEGRLTKALVGDGDKAAKALLCGVAERRKTAEAIPALRELSKSSDPALRAAAERALKGIEPREPGSHAEDDKEAP